MHQLAHLLVHLFRGTWLFVALVIDLLRWKRHARAKGYEASFAGLRRAWGTDPEARAILTDYAHRGARIFEWALAQPA